MNTYTVLVNSNRLKIPAGYAIKSIIVNGGIPDAVVLVCAYTDRILHTHIWKASNDTFVVCLGGIL